MTENMHTICPERHSSNKTVEKAADMISFRKKTLIEKKKTQKRKFYDRYPTDTYGIKAEMMYDEWKEKTNAEIKLLEKYETGLRDLISIVEGNNG